MSGNKADRHGDQAENDQMFREGKGTLQGIKDVGIKKMERVSEQLMGIPCKNPSVQEWIDLRYKTVDHMKRQRPKHDDGYNDKKQ
jgi:hypothetical protein